MKDKFLLFKGYYPSSSFVGRRNPQDIIDALEDRKHLFKIFYGVCRVDDRLDTSSSNVLFAVLYISEAEEIMLTMKLPDLIVLENEDAHKKEIAGLTIKEYYVGADDINVGVDSNGSKFFSVDTVDVSVNLLMCN